MTKLRYLISLLFCLFIALSFSLTRAQAQNSSHQWDDEPNELSWEHFSTCRFCFDDFKNWWAKLPAERRQSVTDAAQKAGMFKAAPDKEASLWIQAESFKGPAWTVSSTGGRTTLKGPLGHNTAIAKRIIDIPVEGDYRLWSHWWNIPGYHNSFRVSIRPIETNDFQYSWQTTDQANYLDHRFAFAWYGRPTPASLSYQVDKNGFQWESTPLFHLPKGRVVIEMTPIISAGPYTYRNIDCFLLTQDPFLTPQETEIPDSKTNDLASLNTTQEQASVGSKADWQLWGLRPAAMALSLAPAPVAKLWRDWRGQLIERLAKGQGNTPHEKAWEHEFYFDSRWNLIGTPAQVAKEASRQTAFSGYFKWVEAEDFYVSKGWEPVVDVRAGKGKILQATSGDGVAEASTTINAPQSGKYRLWVRSARRAKLYNFFKVKIQQENTTVSETEFHEIGPETAVGWTYFWQSIDVELEKGTCEISLAKNVGKAPYAFRKIDCVVLTNNLVWKPEEVQPPVSTSIPEDLPQLAKAAQHGNPVAWLAEDTDQWTGFNMTDWPEESSQIVGSSPIQIEFQPGAVQSRVLHLTNPSNQSITVTPQIAAGADLLDWRLVAYQLSPDFGWQPMPLLRRHEVTIPPHLTASLWLTFDARNFSPGMQTATLNLGSQQVRFKINVTGTDIRHAKVPFVGGWCAPWPTPDGWQTFTNIGLNIVHGKVLPKAQMEKYHIALFNVTLGIPKSADQVHEIVSTMESMGLDYGDWTWEIMDEPSKKTYEKWIEAAKIIRQADPKVRIWCNPGWIGASTAESVTAMAPWVDVFCPYVDHFAAKDPAYQTLLSNLGNPKLLYTTPCFNEKAPAAPLELLEMADLALLHNRDGWDTFSLRRYYPYAASAWDEVNAMYPDQAVSMYPGAWNQVIGSRNLEAERQAIQKWKTAKVLSSETHQ